jgi:large subunit ribosomal protein L19
VRRAKLYYLRGRRGRAARILERLAQYNCIKFDQIADLSDEDSANLDEALKLDGAIEKQDWIGQARALIAEATADEVAPEGEEAAKS